MRTSVRTKSVSNYLYGQDKSYQTSNSSVNTGEQEENQPLKPGENASDTITTSLAE